MSIFHAYDIRGIYQEEITIETAYKLAIAYTEKFSPKKVVIGHDPRIGSEELANALIDGFTDQGVNVTFIGLCTTPMYYFAINHFNSDGGIMVTASHNPKEYNGFKVNTKHAIPIGYEDGLNDIEYLVTNTTMADIIAHPKYKGEVTERFILLDYVKELLPYAAYVEPMTVAIDTSNGATGFVLPTLIENIELDGVVINQKPDGTFPNHTPNPLLEESYVGLRAKMKEIKAELGIIFDGDGDRIAFLDENGKAIRQDTILSIIAAYLVELAGIKNKAVVYDLKCSRATKESLESLGLNPISSKVGHTFIKKVMREHKAVFGGESSGHYFFKDFHYCDNAFMAMFFVLSYFSNRRAQKVSEIITEFEHYIQSGEINVPVNDVQKVLTKIHTGFQTFPMDVRDGISVDCSTYWFNVRPSNTEPLIRVNVEGENEEIVKQKTDELLAIIKSE